MNKYVEHRGAEVAELIKNAVDLSWVMYHVLSEQDREYFDKHLIETQHPLAFRAGTWETRMRAYYKETHK